MTSVLEKTNPGLREAQQQRLRPSPHQAFWVCLLGYLGHKGTDSKRPYVVVTSPLQAELPPVRDEGVRHTEVKELLMSSGTVTNWLLGTRKQESG